MKEQFSGRLHVHKAQWSVAKGLTDKQGITWHVLTGAPSGHVQVSYIADFWGGLEGFHCLPLMQTFLEGTHHTELYERFGVFLVHSLVPWWRSVSCRQYHESGLPGL